MGLSSGTKLGPYEILTPLGAGGMGEVYRARDTKLGRDVALKVLPEVLARDPDRMARFKREAQLLASLNHPNIATIHGLEESETTRALVMEMIEGQTLAEVIGAGHGVPLQGALPIAKQVAEALEYAHERGIIHRDLKPANIKITPEGMVKVLDFGLAKALDVEPSASSSVSNSPTLTAAETRAGVILGTAAYMSPEQARGKPADRRADIWSFGCVLYEMFAGKRLFEGETVSDTLAGVLKAEPDWNVLPASTPPRLRELVRRCLTKDSKQRLQAIGDARIAIEETMAGNVGADPRVRPVEGERRSLLQRALPWAGMIVSAIVAALFAIGYMTRAPIPAHAIRAYVKPAPNSNFTSFNGGTAGIAVSPDGLRLAYVASMPDGKSVLWVRSLDSLQAQPLAGTEGAVLPFWSPDSRFIGFFADGKLKKIEVAGGPPLTLCDAPGGRGGTWNRDGTIVFSPFFSTPLFRVSAAGGAATQVTTVDRSRNQSTHRWPYFLPDGRHFLYLAGNPFTPVDSPTNSIMLGSLDSKETKFLFNSHSNAIFASGHILFLRQNTLMVRPFDSKRLEFTGDAFPIADQVEDVMPRVQGEFSSSENGILAYSERGAAGSRQLIWFDRSGKQVGAVPGTDSYSDPHISPAGKELAFNLESPGSDIWLYDVARDVKTRFTFSSGSSAGNLSQIWSPDSRSIAYASIRNGGFGIYQKAADGSGGEKLLVEPGSEQKYPMDWSPDGKFILYINWESGGADIWVLPLQGDRKPYLLSQAQQTQALSFSSQTTARFSPDGKWLAYTSSESGKFQVYVTPFPGPGGKWQVSTEGGWFPQWRRDGRELFYVSSIDDKIMAAEVKANGSSFEVGAVHTLFEIRPYFGLYTANLFDVTPDGQRFIVVNDAQQPGAALTLVVNWLAALKKP